MRWFRTWGASDVDLARTMAGDARIATPTYAATLAVTIDAQPLDVWPWLAQMGYRRGGLYSYDWLDRLFGYLDGPSCSASNAERNLGASRALPHDASSVAQPF